MPVCKIGKYVNAFSVGDSTEGLGVPGSRDRRTWNGEPVKGDDSTKLGGEGLDGPERQNYDSQRGPEWMHQFSVGIFSMWSTTI